MSALRAHRVQENGEGNLGTIKMRSLRVSRARHTAILLRTEYAQVRIDFIFFLYYAIKVYPEKIIKTQLQNIRILEKLILIVQIRKK